MSGAGLDGTRAVADRFLKVKRNNCVIAAEEQAGTALSLMAVKVEVSLREGLRREIEQAYQGEACQLPAGPVLMES